MSRQGEPTPHPIVIPPTPDNPVHLTCYNFAHDVCVSPTGTCVGLTRGSYSIICDSFWYRRLPVFSQKTVVGPPVCLSTTTGWHPRVALGMCQHVSCVEVPGKALSRPARLSSWENVVVAGPGRHRSWSMFCTPRATRVRHTPQRIREILAKGTLGAWGARRGACLPYICAPGTKVVIINDVKLPSLLPLPRF